MPSRHLPRLINDQLLCAPGKVAPDETIKADSAAWFEWLRHPQHSSFSYQTSAATITVRRERKRNGWYWYAYRAVDGKLRKVYLGKTDDLTMGHLREATVALLGETAPTERAPGLRMSFFGPPQILRDGVPVHLTSAKAVALLAYLSVHNRPQNREYLLTLLWPESAGVQARKNLSNALWTIRAMLGPETVVGDTTLALNERVWVDVRSFEQLSRDAMRLEADGGSALPAYLEMTTLCQGSFMDGVTLLDTPEFETWIEMTRERYHELRLRALRALALAHRAEGRWPEVIAVARAAVMQDALQEPMYRALMEAHAQMGDRATAIRQYDTLRATLDRELGVAPLPETERLRTDILLGKIPQRPVADEAPLADAQPAAGQQPFIGRESEIAALDDVWSAAMATPARVALISGESGVGKSRLWQMWSSRLEPGVTILNTRCLPTTQTLPFAPLADLLRGPILRRRLARVALPSPPAWLDDVLQLAPELRDELPIHSQPPALPAIEERRRMFEALIQGLGFSPDQRVALFIDDLHWADQATIEWLGYLMHRGQDMPFMLAAAFRPEEASPALLKLVSYWGREGMAQRLPLIRLNHDESLLLISALHGDMRRAESLYEQSAGNPYFLIELLRAEPGAMPTALTDLIARRLDHLPGVARQILQVAAVLQPEIDTTMLRHISGRTDEETVDALDALVQAGLLLEQRGGYEFGHPLIAHVVDTEMSRARKSILHRRVAETLERLAAGRLSEVSGRLARHFREAGDTEQAAHYAEMAGDRSLALAAPVEAANFYEQALELFPTPTRYYGLGLARRLQADLDGARAAFSNALRVCEQTGKRTIAAHVCLELGRICLANNQFDEIVTWVQRARAYHHSAGDPRLAQALAAYLMGGYLRGTGQSLKQAETYLTEALMSAIKGNMLELLPGILLEFGTVIGQQGDVTGAIRCFNEMIAFAHTIGDYFHEALGFNCLADQALAVGDMTMARHAIENGLSLARAHRVRLVYQWLFITRGKIALVERQWQEAERWLTRGSAEAERFGAVAQAATCHAYLGLAARGRGQLDEAVRLMETARAQSALASETYFQVEITLFLTELYLERGEPEKAAGVFHKAEEQLRGGDYLLLLAKAERLRGQFPS